MTTEQHLCRIAADARDLEEFLSKNVGETADWPVRLVCDNEDSANQLCYLLQNLSTSIKAMKEFSTTK